MKVTQDMINHFYNRTNSHISLVKKYCKMIYEYNDSKYFLLNSRMVRHDKTKFSEPEFTPYILLTWTYYCKDNNIEFNLDEDDKKQLQIATFSHCKNNRHHPEFHDCNSTVDSINFNNRDKPSNLMVDAFEMTSIDIAEMVADWLAVSEERKTNPYDWAKNNINIRWNFRLDQEVQIYNLLDVCWEK